MAEPAGRAKGGAYGEYLTRGRAAEIERLIAESEARLTARLDALAVDVAEARSLATAGLRAQAKALLDVLKDDLRGSTNGHHP